MKLKNEFWAFIPARSGSKSIKNKNLKKLNNRPLLAYSIISANKSSHIKKIIFSSDSELYAKVASKYGKFFFSQKKKKKFQKIILMILIYLKISSKILILKIFYFLNILYI